MNVTKKLFPRYNFISKFSQRAYGLSDPRMAACTGSGRSLVFSNLFLIKKISY